MKNPLDRIIAFLALASVVVIACLAAAGCANVTVDNGKCHAEYSSFFKSLDGVKMSACNASGEAVKSSPAIPLQGALD